MKDLLEHVQNVEPLQLIVEIIVFAILGFYLWRKGLLTFSSGWKDLYEELETKMGHMETTHEEKMAEYDAKLNKQIELNNAAIAEKEAEIQNLKRKVETLDTELTSARAENSQLRTINNKLQIINMEFAQQVAVFKDDIDKLKEDVAIRQDAYEMAVESRKMLRILLNDEDIRDMLARKKNETGSPEKHALIEKMTETDVD